MRIHQETTLLNEVQKDIECPICKHPFTGTVKNMQYILKVGYFIPISNSKEIIIDCPSCKKKLIYHQTWGELISSKTSIKTFKQRNSIIDWAMLIGAFFIASMPFIGLCFAILYLYLTREKSKLFQIGSKVVLSISIIEHIIILSLYLSGSLSK